MFYPSPSNFFKITRTIFGVIIFQDSAAPSLLKDTFDLQTGRSGQPVMTNGKYSQPAEGSLEYTRHPHSPSKPESGKS